MGADAPFLMHEHNEHPGFYAKWYKIWSEQTPEVLDATAIIRVMECTNGCVQYGFRGESPNALSVEKNPSVISSRVLVISYTFFQELPISVVL